MQNNKFINSGWRVKKDDDCDNDDMFSIFILFFLIIPCAYLESLLHLHSILSVIDAWFI
jgi:hypothetical protein